MGNLADISEPNFHQMSKEISIFNFLSVYSGFNGRNAIYPIETADKPMEN